MEKIVAFKTKGILVLLTLGLTVASAQAQIPDLSKAGQSAGSLLKQFAGQIKPGSFLSSWASGGKSKWLSAAGKVSDAVSMAKSVSSLGSFIKPEMFKQGFNLSSITQGASAVKSMSDAGGLLKNLEGGMKPEAFLGSWASKKPAFMSALDMLK